MAGMTIATPCSAALPKAPAFVAKFSHVHVRPESQNMTGTDDERAVSADGGRNTAKVIGVFVSLLTWS